MTDLQIFSPISLQDGSLHLAENLPEGLHAAGRRLLDVDEAAVADGKVIRVDDVDGRLPAGVPVQAGGGVDGQGCADDQQDVGRFDGVDRLFDHRDAFAEPHDVRPQLAAVRGLVPEADFRIADVEDFFLREGAVVDAGLRADFRQFAVQVDDAGAAGPFVEVVDILGDDGDVVVLLQRGDGFVGGVGSHVFQLEPLPVVEIQQQAAVGVPALDGGDGLRVVLFPEAAVVAEGADAALGADARAGQYGDVLSAFAHSFCSK